MSAGRKHISEKKDWNTPPKYIESIKEFFGTIDLDPCSNEYSNIDATVEYKLPTDGLLESWNYKRIFVNPPYGRNIQTGTSIYDWVSMGVKSSELGNELLFLIPVATNTKHFKHLIFKHASGICFLEDTRLKFWNNGKEDKKGAPMACCMVYFGNRYNIFESIFKRYGKCFLIK
jgi:hypothetical protein